MTKDEDICASSNQALSHQNHYLCKGSFLTKTFCLKRMAIKSESEVLAPRNYTI